jgi:hypothetical protein
MAERVYALVHTRSCSLTPLRSSDAAASTGCKAPIGATSCASSHEVFGPPGVPGNADSRTSSRFAAPAYDTPSGFLNLLTFSSLPCLVRLSAN